MLRKIGMVGFMSLITGAIMLPNVVLAQDCYPAAHPEYHRAAREHVDRDLHDRDDYRADQIRYHQHEYRYDGGGNIREHRHEARNTYGVHFPPQDHR